MKRMRSDSAGTATLVAGLLLSAVVCAGNAIEPAKQASPPIPSTAQATQPSQAQPNNVSPRKPLPAPVESQHETEVWLVLATWVLVGVTGWLARITARGAAKQSEDMQAYIAVARDTAGAASRSADAANASSRAASEAANLAAQDRREALVREVNIAAHKVTTVAAQIDRHWDHLVRASAALAIPTGGRAEAAAHEAEMATVRKRTKELVDAGVTLLTALTREPETLPDDRLSAELRVLDGRLVEAEAMKEDVLWKLEQHAERYRLFREEGTAMRAAKMMNSGKA